MGRTKHSNKLKAQIALDAIKGQKTISELVSEYGDHAYQISRWKKQLLDAAPVAFARGKDKNAKSAANFCLFGTAVHIKLAGYHAKDL